MQCLSFDGKLELNNTIVTVGKFDGLHKGHEKLLDIMKENANGRQKVVLTFEREPKAFLNDLGNKTIVTEREKKLLLDEQEIDVYIKMPLTKEFLGLTPKQFIRQILVDRMGATTIVCGTDFRFGTKASGDVDYLRSHQDQFGYTLKVVEKEQYHNEDISSSAIREKITQGKMAEVCEMLNHPYCIIGTVEQGKHLGRTMGLPTANIIPEKTKLLPPFGVYRTMVLIAGKRYHAISNIGVNPTVEHGSQIKVESHILDYQESIYGQVVQVLFYEFIRPEQDFGSVEELSEQIRKDIAFCKKHWT